MLKSIRLIICSLVFFSTGHASSAYLNPPTINFSSPTTEDFIVANISGNYSTPGFVLSSPPVVTITTGSINIIFNVDSPAGPVPFVLDPFDYSVDVGRLTAGDWYVTPVIFIDGIFDTTYVSTEPLFTVSAVPVPAAIWLFGSGLAGLISLVGCRPHNGQIRISSLLIRQKEIA